MKKICAVLLLALILILLCGAAVADSDGELPVFVAPEGVTMTEHEAWNKEMDGYSTRGWLLTGSDIDTMGQAIETYANGLEDWGFIMTDEVEPKGLDACYWFFDIDETGYTTAELNGYEFEVFVYGEANSDGTQIGLLIGCVSGIEFQEEQQWDSLFGEEPVWDSVFDQEEPDAATEPVGYKIPSFESFAGEALTVLGQSGNTLFCSMTIEHMAVVDEYVELLEEYGLYGTDGSEPEYGFPYFYWIENCEHEIAPLEIPTNGGTLRGYCVIALKTEGETLTLTVLYAEGLLPVDTGERWNVSLLSESEVEQVKETLALFEAATGKTEEDNAAEADDQPIATNDGLTVLSPEQYLGIEPCDEIYRDDNHYTYAYTDRGYKYHGAGTANPVDWYKMEEYVNALVESGYYEILEHSDDPDDAYWTLRYIGPAEVNNTFYLYYGMSDQAAITLRNFIGDIKIRYSIDILTADIADTQERLGEYVIATQQSSTGGSSGDCTYCGGDGKCDECGGDVWYYDFDFVYVNGAPELQYVRKMCTDANCNYGKCYMCGGDGVR